MRRHHKGILDAIRESKQFSEDTEQQVVDAVKTFKKQFTAADGSSSGKEAEAESMDADEVERESVKVAKPDPRKKAKK
jgi:F-type H+-transporting ATPase subunit alpha